MTRFISLTATLALLMNPLISKALPPPSDFSIENENTLAIKRDCQNPCGWQAILCCEAHETCYTDEYDQAQCGTAANYPVVTTAGTWEYYTSVWVETGLVTRTSVWSTYVPVAVATGLACNYDLNESPCGSICCTSNQYCLQDGQCVASGFGSTIQLSTLSVAVTPTITLPFQTPVATGLDDSVIALNSSGDLSAGEIAGIVIGVLIGVFLLFLLCLLCCFRAVFDKIMALFGMGKRQKYTSRHSEKRHDGRYHSYGSSNSGRRWHGRPARSDVPSKKGPSRLGQLGVGLMALAGGLGAKKHHDRHDHKSSSGSYFSSSYYTTSSSNRSSNRSSNPQRSGTRTSHT